MENTLFFRKFGTGKPLIILHGLFGSSDNWMSIGKILAEKYVLYIPDQRNHGRSFHTNEFNYELLVQDLHTFIKSNNILNPSILGHSMGGKVAMKFSINYPKELNNLIVADIAPKFYPVRHQRILEGLLSINLNSITSRSDADENLSNYINQSQIRQFLLKNLVRTKQGRYEWKINLSAISEYIDEMGNELGSEERFYGPTLFIEGANSDYIQENDHTLIKTIFPNSKISTIVNAGHWLHAEQPLAFNQLVLDFLGN